MFNKFYKFYKFNINTPVNKFKTHVFIGKDLRYNRVEYYNIISHLIGKNWVLENKLIDVEILILKKVFRFSIVIVLIYYISLLIIF